MFQKIFRAIENKFNRNPSLPERMSLSDAIKLSAREHNTHFPVKKLGVRSKILFDAILLCVEELELSPESNPFRYPYIFDTKSEVDPEKRYDTLYFIINESHIEVFDQLEERPKSGFRGYKSIHKFYSFCDFYNYYIPYLQRHKNSTRYAETVIEEGKINMPSEEIVEYQTKTSNLLEQWDNHLEEQFRKSGKYDAMVARFDFLETNNQKK